MEIVVTDRWKDGYFCIMKMKRMSNFCVFTALLENDIIKGNLTINDNAFNPTISDIQSGNCSN